MKKCELQALNNYINFVLKDIDKKKDECIHGAYGHLVAAFEILQGYITDNNMDMFTRIYARKDGENVVPENRLAIPQ